MSSAIVTSLVRKPGPHGLGRRCRKCPTILSSWNPSDVCSRHGGWHEPMGNGKAEQEQRAKDLSEVLDAVQE